MDRPVRKPAITLRALGLELISRSRFEDSTPSSRNKNPSSRNSLIEVLQLMGQLEPITQRSLRESVSPTPDIPSNTSPTPSAPEIARTSSCVTSPAHPAQPPQARMPLPATGATSAREEYRPALENPQIVDALMRVRMNGLEARKTKTMTTSSFTPAQVPRIDAQPKTSPLSAKGPAGSFPVFRSDSRES